MSELSERLYKICIVGDGAVGKTTILHQYVDGKFISDTRMTIGSDFFIKGLVLRNFNLKVRLQIWDLGGQGHFSNVRPSYYLGAKGIIYTFDLSRVATFKNLIDWKTEVSRVLNENVPTILIGNKLDLINEEQRTITHEDILSMQKELNALNYYGTSAKDNTGIDNAFRRLAIYIFKFLNQESLD